MNGKIDQILDAVLNVSKGRDELLKRMAEDLDRTDRAYHVAKKALQERVKLAGCLDSAKALKDMFDIMR